MDSVSACALADLNTLRPATAPKERMMELPMMMILLLYTVVFMDLWILRVLVNLSSELAFFHIVQLVASGFIGVETAHKRCYTIHF